MKKLQKQELGVNMDQMLRNLRNIEKKKGFIDITIVAEKPNVAKKILIALAPEKDKKTKKSSFTTGKWKGFNAFIFKSKKFHGINARFTVISVYGHVYK